MAGRQFTSQGTLMKGYGTEPTWRCHQNPFIRAPQRLKEKQCVIFGHQASYLFLFSKTFPCWRLVWITLGFSLVLPCRASIATLLWNLPGHHILVPEVKELSMVLGLDTWVFSLHLQASCVVPAPWLAAGTLLLIVFCWPQLANGLDYELGLPEDKQQLEGWPCTRESKNRKRPPRVHLPSNIPFDWFLVKGCNRQDRDFIWFLVQKDEVSCLWPCCFIFFFVF